MIKTYSELITIPNFADRFEYLRLNGEVGVNTFGFDRIFNQHFYTSNEWQSIRRYVILRDNGCDLAHLDYPIESNYKISGKRKRSLIFIHHINPIAIDDISKATSKLLDPENLICCSYNTHNAIHFGTKDFISSNTLLERNQNDTCPWKK